MNKLLPILLLSALALSSCAKHKLKYSCICTYDATSKVYDDHDYAKGWKKDVINYCENDLGSYAKTIGVTCKMYDSKDDFYRCSTIATNENSIPGKTDTSYFFPGISETEIAKFQTEHTFKTTNPDGTTRKHYVVCSREWGSVF